MKKLLILTFALLLCLMATSALAATTTYDSTWKQDIIINEPGEHTIILNGVNLEWYDDMTGDMYYYEIIIQSQDTKVTVVLEDGTTNHIGSVRSFKGDSDIIIRCEEKNEGHECADNCGKVIISVSDDSANDAAIGSTWGNDFNGSITIVGGNITIKKSSWGALIGSGSYGDMSGTITIMDSTVTIEEGGRGAGIGSGYHGNMSGTITIADSTVTIEDGSWSAGIGSGEDGEMSGTITIADSTITAKTIRGASIGAGDGGDFTGKLIMRGDVDVTAIGEYWGIGPGHDGSIGEGAEIYVEPTNGNVIGVKQGYDEESAVNLAGTPYSVKTDLIPLLNGSRYVRTRYNTETVTPTSCYGGTATCVNLAICDDCGKGYGELNKKNHIHKVILPYVPPTTTSTGLTEGLKCSDCSTIIIPQQIIPMLPTDFPQTGDETNFVLLAALALVGMISMTAIIRRKNEA